KLEQARSAVPAANTDQDQEAANRVLVGRIQELAFLCRSSAPRMPLTGCKCSAVRAARLLGLRYRPSSSAGGHRYTCPGRLHGLCVCQGCLGVAFAAAKWRAQGAENRTLRSRAYALAAVQSRARPSTARDETPALCGRRRWSPR